MAPLAAAAILLENGIDPIMELGCCNRNRVALLSDLLGARALGVTSLLLIRGKKAPAEFMPQTQYLVGTNVTDLIGFARKVFEDEEMSTRINFLLGTHATVHDRLEDWNPERLNNLQPHPCCWSCWPRWLQFIACPAGPRGVFRRVSDGDDRTVIQTVQQ